MRPFYLNNSLSNEKLAVMWRRLELNQESEFALWIKLDNELHDPERPKSIYSNPLWLRGSDGSQLGRLAVYEGNEALATFILGPTSLPLYLGELAVGKISFQRATLTDFRVGARQDHPEDLLESLLCLATRNFGCDIVFHIETHGLGFAREIEAFKAGRLGRQLLWLIHGHHTRRLIHLKGSSFDEYFSRLSRKTRSSIRRVQAKFLADLGEEPQLVRVTEANQVDDFLDRAGQVSRKTYQWQLLGLGLHNDAKTKASLRFAAEQGWLRSYLFCYGQEPVAFILGYQYADTYQGRHSGYDPALAKYSIGIRLWIAAIADLFNTVRPKWLDFGSGDAEYKHSMANIATVGMRIYLWPPTWRNRLFVGTYKAVEGLNRFGNWAATGLKIKPWLKKALRKHTQRVDVDT